MYEDSNFSTSSPIQLLTVFLIKAILMGVKWYHIVVLICLCLMANNAVFSHGHWPFVWLWQNVFSYLLPIFSVGFFVFSLLSCKCCLYILNLIRYVICKYFLTFCGSLFTLLMVVLWNTKVLNFDEDQFMYFFFCCMCFGIISVKPMNNGFQDNLEQLGHHNKWWQLLSVITFTLSNDDNPLSEIGIHEFITVIDSQIGT